MLDIIEATLQNKVELGKQEDEFLASFPPGDLELIDDSAAYIPFHSVAYFRMLAAIQSGQDFTARSTATQVAREIEYKQTLGDGRLTDREFNTLQRVFSLVAERSNAPPAG